ncbi:hypothetical protein M3I54_11690 [Paraburkholderia sp. CNPSo 3274]|uniref:hypothetical protein n=1 Tax=Paraburkholderia sp. CNPSo 3274 TaxID=2940932 RepID=UPI0020B7291E|nr:hypothetical protein [Paraburkholderia sp. CNPSo 3274]MCP3707642.1 hypothetical protein [Paraburkholderia sp. CNPSo 3274]
MEFVVVAAIVAVSFGAAATWLLATRLPERWLDTSASEGRYAHLGLEDERAAEADPRREQARIDTRRVRRSRVRARLQSAAQMMRALRPATTRRDQDRTARP